MDVVHLKLETEIPELRCVFNEGEELKFLYTSPSPVVVSFTQRAPYDRNRPAVTGNGVCSAVTQLHIEPSVRSNIHDAIDNERITIGKIERENLQILDDVFIHLLRNVSRSTATIFNWVNGLDDPPNPLSGEQALYSEDGDRWL